MPFAADTRALEGAATLLWEAQTLYESVLPHLHDEIQRDEMCGLVAVRGALCLRLRDQLETMGQTSALPRMGGASDARCPGIFRRLTQGDTAGALAEIDAWDARVRDQIRARVRTEDLSRRTVDNLLFTLQTLEAAPANFGGLPLAVSTAA